VNKSTNHIDDVAEPVQNLEEQAEMMKFATVLPTRIVHKNFQDFPGNHEALLPSGARHAFAGGRVTG